MFLNEEVLGRFKYELKEYKGDEKIRIIKFGAVCVFCLIAFSIVTLENSQRESIDLLQTVLLYTINLVGIISCLLSAIYYSVKTANINVCLELIEIHEEMVEEEKLKIKIEQEKTIKKNKTDD